MSKSYKIGNNDIVDRLICGIPQYYSQDGFSYYKEKENYVKGLLESDLYEVVLFGISLVAYTVGDLSEKCKKIYGGNYMFIKYIDVPLTSLIPLAKDKLKELKLKKSSMCKKELVDTVKDIEYCLYNPIRIKACHRFNTDLKIGCISMGCNVSSRFFKDVQNVVNLDGWHDYDTILHIEGEGYYEECNFLSKRIDGFGKYVDTLLKNSFNMACDCYSDSLEDNGGIIISIQDLKNLAKVQVNIGSKRTYHFEFPLVDFINNNVENLKSVLVKALHNRCYMEGGHYENFIKSLAYLPRVVEFVNSEMKNLNVGKISIILAGRFDKGYSEGAIGQRLLGVNTRSNDFRLSSNDPVIIEGEYHVVLFTGLKPCKGYRFKYNAERF